MRAALLLIALFFSAGDEDQAIRAVDKLGGTVRRDDSRPGRPVVAVELPGCSVSADFLKIAQRFPHLEWLDL